MIKASKQWLAKKATKKEQKIYGKLRYCLSQLGVKAAVQAIKTQARKVGDPDDDVQDLDNACNHHHNYKLECKALCTHSNRKQ